MTSRSLIALNAALALIALAAIGYVVRELRVPVPAPDVARRPVPAAAPAAAATRAAAEAPSGAYSVVAARNLFSPTRSEAPPSPAAAALPATVKPSLYGVLVSDTTLVAYLEDPITKRVAGYRIGESVAGGTLTQIGADYVVLNRPDGDVNVRLRAPFKPRSAPAAVPGQGGRPMPVVPRVPNIPGVPPALQPIPQLPTPGLGAPLPVLPRRPLPPNLSRRLPPAGTDAPAQD